MHLNSINSRHLKRSSPDERSKGEMSPKVVVGLNHPLAVLELHHRHKWRPVFVVSPK